VQVQAQVQVTGTVHPHKERARVPVRSVLSPHIIVVVLLAHPHRRPSIWHLRWHWRGMGMGSGTPSHTTILLSAGSSSRARAFPRGPCSNFAMLLPDGDCSVCSPLPTVASSSASVDARQRVPVDACSTFGYATSPVPRYVPGGWRNQSSRDSIAQPKMGARPTSSYLKLPSQGTFALRSLFCGTENSRSRPFAPLLLSASLVRLRSNLLCRNGTSAGLFPRSAGALSKQLADRCTIDLSTYP